MANTLRNNSLNQALKNEEKSLPNRFACECGKNYSNYPALYLHFQRKHNQVISTRIENQNCRVREQGNIRVITYFYSAPEGNDSRKKDLLIQWEGCIKDFMDFEAENERLDFQWKECMHGLLDYIKQASNMDIYKSDRSLKQLPEFFNSFMLQKIAEIEDAQFTRWCDTLTKFSCWLFQRKLSKVVV